VEYPRELLNEAHRTSRFMRKEISIVVLNYCFGMVCYTTKK
jgi:hypothetical protein